MSAGDESRRERLAGFARDVGKHVLAVLAAEQVKHLVGWLATIAAALLLAQCA